MQRNKRKTDWERLEISSRKLEIPREHFMQRWAQKRTKMIKRWQEYTEELYKKIFTTKTITLVSSLT